MPGELTEWAESVAGQKKGMSRIGWGLGGRVITCTPQQRCSEWARPMTDSCLCQRSLMRWTPLCWTLKDTETFQHGQ